MDEKTGWAAWTAIPSPSQRDLRTGTYLAIVDALLTNSLIAA